MISVKYPSSSATQAETIDTTLSDLTAKTTRLVDDSKAAEAHTPEAIARVALKSVFTVRTATASGSSFVWQQAARGPSLLITNAHVLQGVKVGGTVMLSQKTRKWTARVVEVNVDEDLAVLAATLPGVPALQPGGSPESGSTVIAIGAPFGLDGSVTTGALSASRGGALQFSAPISPGNSGGALLDLTGHVIGVTSAKVVIKGAEGIGIAIPISTICGALRAAC